MVLFTCLVLVLAGIGIAELLYLLSSKAKYEVPACISIALSITLLSLLAILVRMEVGTPIPESSLAEGKAYVVLGEAAYDSERYFVIVKREGGEGSPRLYAFREPPPERFLVIHNEKGNREYLPRPLPKGK